MSTNLIIWQNVNRLKLNILTCPKSLVRPVNNSGKCSDAELLDIYASTLAPASQTACQNIALLKDNPLFP